MKTKSNRIFAIMILGITALTGMSSCMVRGRYDYDTNRYHHRYDNHRYDNRYNDNRYHNY